MKRANVTQWPPTSLDQWLDEATQASTFSDAHVDDLDKQWEPKKRWIEAGCALLEAAVGILSSRDSAHRIAVSYTLMNKSVFPAIQTPKQLEKQFDHTPPSIYVAAPGHEPWLTQNPTMSAVTIPADITQQLFPCALACRGVLISYSPANSEVVQSVWFIPS